MKIVEVCNSINCDNYIDCSPRKILNYFCQLKEYFAQFLQDTFYFALVYLKNQWSEK